VWNEENHPFVIPESFTYLGGIFVVVVEELSDIAIVVFPY
jgi:hypothetical protein